MDTTTPRCKHVKLGDPPTLVNRDGRSVSSRAMRKYFFLDGRKTSAKAVAALLGLGSYQRAVGNARVAHYAESGAEYALETPNGRLTIVFRDI